MRLAETFLVARRSKGLLALPGDAGNAHAGSDLQRRRSVPLALAIAASALGSQTTQDDSMSAYGWVMMTIFATLFAALLVTAIWALYSYTTRTRADQERGSPEELLAERYARGDITTEDYQERLDTLRE